MFDAPLLEYDGRILDRRLRDVDDFLRQADLTAFRDVRNARECDRKPLQRRGAAVAIANGLRMRAGGEKKKRDQEGERGTETVHGKSFDDHR